MNVPDKATHLVECIQKSLLLQRRKVTLICQLGQKEDEIIVANCDTGLRTRGTARNAERKVIVTEVVEEPSAFMREEVITIKSFEESTFRHIDGVGGFAFFMHLGRLVFSTPGKIEIGGIV